MIKNITDREKTKMEISIANCLKCITNDVNSLKMKDKLEEPDYIAALCLCFPNKLKNILNTFFYDYLFSVTGIFCHQKPIAQIFDEPKGCEIGDLLFIYIHTDIQGNKLYNSLFLQAKISNEKRISLSSEDDLRQLRLYTQWPDFSYKRADPLNGTKRCIVPKTSSNGAKYLIIDPTHVSFTKNNVKKDIYKIAFAHDPLYLNNRLSLELIGLISFNTGKPFEERPDNLDIKDNTWSKDEWSKMIWDIINITKSSKSKRKNIRFNSFSRTTIAEHCLYYTQQMDSGFYSLLFEDIDDKNITSEYSTEEPNGLPMIIIESQEQN